MVRFKVSQRGLRRALSATLLGSTVLAGAGGAFAAAPGTPATVQEVIVTANKREESIQKVPMSIQALDTKKLEQLNIQDFQDYSKFLPSLSVETTGPSSTSITMRGIASGENYNHSGPLPTVGFYLDEQPITTIGGTLDIHIYDIQRIESLAGPQGTLYGASSESGTVRIITNKPDPTHFSASYDLQANSVDHGGIGGGAEGYVNIPLGDRAAIRLVGWDTHDAGFIDNVHATRDFSTGQHIDNAPFVKKDFNWTDTYGGRAALKVDLNENWSVTPSIIAQDQHQHGVYGFNPSVGDLKVERFGPDESHDRWYQAALTVQGKIGKYDLTYSGGYFHRQVDAVSDYMDYSYAYDQASGYAYYWAHTAPNPYDPSTWTPVANPRQFIVGRDEFWKNSQEIRLASPSTDRFRFVVGAYYQRQDHWIIQDYQIDGFAPNLSVPRWPQTLWLTDQMRQDQDEAVYGQFDFDLTDKLILTGGIRGYTYRNSLRGFFGYSAPFGVTFGVPQDGFGPGGANCLSFHVYRNGPGCIDLDKTTSGSGETHRLTLTYKFDADKLMYATYSTGYRPGGENRIVGTAPAYGADFLSNYEIGWKTSWMDHSLRWNGAIYDEEWNNFQFSFLVPPSITAIANAGHARVLGVESDIVWVPTEHLTISASGAYNDARLTANYCGVVGVTNCPTPLAPKNETLPRTPPFKGNLTARYTFDMGPWNSHLQGSVVYADSTWPELVLDDRNNEGRMPAYTMFDFAFGGERGNLSWELFVKNAFDERAELTRTTPCTTSVCAPPVGVNNYSAVYVFPQTPRTIGFRFGQKF